METTERIEQKIAGVRQAIQYLHTIAIEQEEALHALQAENADLRKQIEQKDTAYAQILKEQSEAHDLENRRRDEERATFYDVLNALKKNRGNLAKSKRDNLDEKGKLKKAWKKYDEQSVELKKAQDAFDKKYDYYHGLEQQVNDRTSERDDAQTLYKNLLFDFNRQAETVDAQKEQLDEAAETITSLTKQLETERQEKEVVEDQLNTANAALQAKKAELARLSVGDVQVPVSGNASEATDDEDVASFVAAPKHQEMSPGGMQS